LVINGFNEAYNTNALKLGIKIANMKIEGIGKSEHGEKGKYRKFDIKKLKKHFNIIKGEGCLINLKTKAKQETKIEEY